MNSRPLVRTLFASAAIAAAVALGGCNYTDTAMMPGRAMAPLSDKMLAELEQKNMDKDSPILVRIFKTEAELEVWKKNRNGEFALLKTYPICRWSGDLGPKIKEGDRQAPEGFYTITPGQMNPNSQFYLAFNMGYPNAFDKALGRTGSQLMVHGDCSSRGCYAMTDEQISEIYSLGRESFFGGQKAFQVQAYPFHMTAENMAKHRNSPHYAFWKMIKQGSDHFEVTKQEPKVDFCEKRYVFNAAAPGDSSKALSFNASAQCPVYEVPREIADAVNARQRLDEVKTAQLIARGTPVAASRAGVDGGMHQVFAAKLQGLGNKMDSDGRITVAASESPITSRVGIVTPANMMVAPVSEPAPVALASAPAAPAQAETSKAATGLASLIKGKTPAAPAAAPVETASLRGSEPAAKPSLASRIAAPVKNMFAGKKPAAETQTASATPAVAAPQHSVFPPPPTPKFAQAAPAPTKRDEAPPVAETRTAYAATPPANNTVTSSFMTGSQPALAAGSFNSRFTGR